jgi:transcriptional regulator with XRE-family HTH domain
MARRNRPRSIGGETNLSQRIALEREQRGWSYETLAKRMADVGCPIAGSAIYKVEKGDPPRRVTVDELLALSEVFGLTLDELLTPVEVVRKQRAQELIAELAPTERALDAAVDRMVDLMAEVLELTAGDPDLYEYVSFHWFGAGEADEDEEPDPDPPRLSAARRELLQAIVEAAGDIIEASQDAEEVPQ